MLRGASLAFLCASCATYEARPLDAQHSRATFEARRLDDAALVEFARAHASGEFPPQRWDLDALTLVAFYAHPDLAVARSRAAVARAAEVTAGQRPNPTLALAPEYVTNAKSGVDPWIFGFHLDFPIEVGQKRELRVEGARRASDLAALDVDVAAWRVRSDLRTAFTEHALLRTEIAFARDVLERQREVVAALGGRFEAGEVSRPDVAAGEIALAQADLDVADVARRLREAHAQLAQALGVPESALEGLDLAEPQLALPLLDPVRARDLALLGGLELRRARVEYELAETELHAAVVAQYPDVHIAPGYTWDQGDHKFAFGASFELPLFHTNQGAIGEASARRDTARSRFEAAQARVLGEVDRALALERGASAQLARANELAQFGRQRVDAEQHAFDAGASDRLALSQARWQSALLERARIEALRRVSEAQGALEDVLQRPLKDLEEAQP